MMVSMLQCSTPSAHTLKKQRLCEMCFAIIMRTISNAHIFKVSFEPKATKTLLLELQETLFSKFVA